MKKSAGILLFKRTETYVLIFLVHPGGPFWKNKDLGAWSIPKGEVEDSEDFLERTKTEFFEETGQSINGTFIELSPIRLKSGKKVYAWAVEGDIKLDKLKSNSFKLEWPPKSGKIIEMPEVDKWEWFEPGEAKQRIIPAQIPFILEVENLINKGKK